MIIRPTYKETLIVLDKPTVTGRIYRQSSFVNMPLNVFGFIYPDVPMTQPQIDLSKVAFEAESLRFENDELVADINFLGTPLGQIAYSLHQTRAYAIRPISMANINSKGEVSNAQIFAAFIIDKALA